MSQSRRLSVSGYCPEQETDYMVELRLTEVPRLGTSVGHKISIENCAYYDKNGCTQRVCPIVKQFQETHD